MMLVTMKCLRSPQWLFIPHLNFWSSYSSPTLEMLQWMQLQDLRAVPYINHNTYS